MASHKKDYKNSIFYQIKQSVRKSFASFEPKIHLMSVCYYGSRKFGLGRDDSNLNIFLDINSSYWHAKRPNQALKDVDFLKNVFICSPEWGSVVTERYTCSAPVITAKHLASGVKCVFSTSGGCMVEHSKFENYLYNLQPHARKFIGILKEWFENYFEGQQFQMKFLRILAVFYLQQQGLLPSTDQIQAFTEPRIFPYWNYAEENCKGIESRQEVNVAFKKYIHRKKYGIAKLQMADLPDLLIGFFQFWLKFDFHSNKVDAKTGEMTRKRNPNDNVEVFGLLLPRNVAIPCKMKWVYKLRDCCKDAMKSKCLMVIADKFKEDKAANMSYYY